MSKHYASSPSECPAGWRFVSAGRSSQCVPPGETANVAGALTTMFTTPATSTPVPAANGVPPLLARPTSPSTNMIPVLAIAAVAIFFFLRK